MDVGTKTELRLQTERARRAPQKPIEIKAGFDSGGVLGEDARKQVSTLVVEATGNEGQLAEWLDDSWWTDVFQVWSCEAVTVHIAPTNGALLHPDIIKQVEMIHRVVPWWRVIGFAFADDVVSESQIDALVRSAYDEVRFIDTRRSQGTRSTVENARTAEREHDASNETRPLSELFGAIRFEQSRVGNTKLILVRLPATAADRF